jgi:hypothetical protein
LSRFRELNSRPTVYEVAEITSLSDAQSHEANDPGTMAGSMRNSESTYGFSLERVREGLGEGRGKPAESFFPRVRETLACLDAGDVEGARALLVALLQEVVS